jgi:D-galactarolactone cycloisomerase
MVYATGCQYRQDFGTPETTDVNETIMSCAKEAQSFKDAGFRAVKMFVGLLSVENDLKRVAAVREAIGYDMKLMVDANHAYYVPTAVHLAKEMEKYKVSWFEEPVVPEDIEGYRRVQAETIIPIAGGECSFMRYGFRDLFVGPSGPCLQTCKICLYFLGTVG